MARYRLTHAAQADIVSILFWSHEQIARAACVYGVCILCSVTRLNVYLPDKLAAEAKKAGLNLSAVTQEAVRRALAERSTDAWLATVVSTPSPERVPHDRALDALDAARNGAPTHHG